MKTNGEDKLLVFDISVNDEEHANIINIKRLKEVLNLTDE
jgi:hypothetical protein